MDNRITKENILARTNSYDLINYYLSPYHNQGKLKKGKHISNPFLPEKQKTPSFNIYEGKDAIWRYKDFATEDEGTVFDLVMKIKGCDFKESLRIINRDLSLGLGEIQKLDFNIDPMDWNQENIKFWEKYGITKEVLQKYQVSAIKSYTRISSRLTIRYSDDHPIYAYKFAENCFKLYQPKTLNFRFMHLGTKPNNYVFGYSQLPDKGDSVYITAGEKDVMSLASKGYYGISLNSETATISESLVKDLKNRFKKVIVLYDLDKTGDKKAIKLANDHRLFRLVLPNKLIKQGGNDVSDFFMNGYSLEDEDVVFDDSALMSFEGKFLSQLLETQKGLTKRKSEKISFASPILKYHDNGLIFPRTINIIQGKAGVHKSRLAETICSAFIKTIDCTEELLDLKTDYFSRPTVCYVDTERNLSDQFPYAIQQILLKGGYEKEDCPSHFDYISLLEVKRKERFAALNEYLEHVRQKFQGHLVIVLDVITDCIKDFNRSEDSMELIDLMNESINKYDVTFIGLIHENPGSADKARGHLGTELMNKSSTVIQVGFERGKNNEPSDLIALKFLKTRSTHRFEPMYLRYCNDTRGLVFADSSLISEVMQSRQLKAEVPDIVEFLEENLTKSFRGSELIELLSEEFDCSKRIVRQRLKDIIEKEIPISIKESKEYILVKYQEGKEKLYKLSEKV